MSHRNWITESKLNQTTGPSTFRNLSRSVNFGSRIDKHTIDAGSSPQKVTAFVKMVINEPNYGGNKAKQRQLSNTTTIHDQFNLKMNQEKNAEKVHNQYKEIIKDQASMFRQTQTA